MRLTTKITLGIILSIFFISLTSIISLSFTDWKNNSSYDTVTELPQDNPTGIELAAFKTIVIDRIPFELQERRVSSLSANCNLYFSPVSEKNNPDMLFIPEVLKEFVAVNTINDTLTVKLNLCDLGKKYKNDEYRFNAFSGVNLYFNTSKIDIINKVSALSINIKNIETDNIKINSNGNIFIDSCKAQLIDPIIRGGYKEVKITTCDIKRLNLDLDYIKNWDFDKGNIEEVHITGSKEHHITLSKNISGSKYWIPKNNDAKLNVKLQGDTAKITFP